MSIQDKLPFFLCLIPGLGHLYLKMTKKGISLLFVSAGIAGLLFFSSWALFKILAAAIYVLTVATSGLEVYAETRGKKAELSNSRGYLSVLLIMTGFNALPLLWQSDTYSKRGKVLWTVFVFVGAAGFFSLIYFMGEDIENYLSEHFQSIY